jgi:hypothetical protein
MKQIITFLFVFVSITAKSQAPVCLVNHGCNGATVTAYSGDTLWTSITYQFQRFEGGSWVTVQVQTGTNNWHLVHLGDITVNTNYRAVLRNNVTNEERTSNVVTVHPAFFSNLVVSPNPQIKFYWGTDLNSGVNAVEFLPYEVGSLLNHRPPFTFEYKKTSDIIWQSRVATTGIFIFPVEANTPYQFRVTNVCGQTSPVISSELPSQATAVQIGSNCSGGIIQVNVSGDGEYFAQRAPFTFGYALIPPGGTVTDSLLNTISYTYLAGNITGLAHGNYVVRGQDRFGVKTKFVAVGVNVNPTGPNITSFIPGPDFCRYSVLLEANPFEKGIREAGSGLPYIFSTGLAFNNLIYGISYEIVLKDACGRLSTSILNTAPLPPPQINNVAVTKSNCNFVYTINASICNLAEYGLKSAGSNNITWQASNIFSNIPMTVACDSVFVRYTTGGLIAKREVCKESFIANIITDRTNPDCNSNYYINITPINNNPPYTYSISYDGINFSSQTSNNVFDNLVPGTYTVRSFDGCGLPISTDDNTREAGSVYYLKESGINTNCANGDTVGSYMKFGLRLFRDDNILSPPPYSYVVKEVTGSNGTEIVYGNTVSAGQSQDTVFTIRGLQGDKNYGIFITNGCGQEFTPAKRVANSYYIPPFIPLASDPQVDVTNCNTPYIFVSTLPTNCIVRIFSGRDTTGTLVPMVNVNTSSVLPGGYYTVKVQTENNNPCYSEKINEVSVKTNDSTSAGQFDPNVSSTFCAGIPNAINLHNNIIHESPGGGWSSSPVLNWSNQNAGELIPANQTPGTYNVTYADTSICGNISEVNFQIIIGLQYCSFSDLGDFESAASSAGCKSYLNDGWNHVFNTAGNLVLSVNAGNGNSIQSACWGVRAVSPFSANVRTTVINGNTVYFAARNFYIEPSSVTIGNTPVRVRLYYSNDEITQLLNYLHTHGFPGAAINNLYILKKKAGPSSPVNLDLAYDPGAPISLYTKITPTAVPYSFGNYYFEFEISSFSELALAFGNSSALPVSWLSVNGKLQNINAIIEWATASESNSSHFEIEHSSNGITYNKVGSKVAAGTSSSTSNYSFTHVSPPVGKNFYRIKQVDLDGKFTYSSIVVLQNSDVKAKVIIAPNPVISTVSLYFSKTGNKTIQLISMDGRVLTTQNINGANSTHSINMGHMPAGVYILRLVTGKGTDTYKINKQ